MLEEIMKVLQSNENFPINDGQMTTQITVVRLPVGSSRKHGAIFDFKWDDGNTIFRHMIFSPYF